MSERSECAEYSAASSPTRAAQVFRIRETYCAVRAFLPTDSPR